MESGCIVAERIVPMRFERRRQAESSFMPHMHLHTFLEIYYLLEGTCTYLIDTQTYPLRAGMLAFVAPNCIHRTVSGAHERVLLELQLPREDWEALASQRYGVISLAAEERAQAEALLALMQREMTEKQPGYDRTAAALATALVRLVARNTGQKLTQTPTRTLRQLHAHSAAQYIALHYAQTLRLEEIAEAIYVSKYYLCHAFRAEMGVSVIEYLISVRVMHAIELLENSRRSITEIATQVGFESSAHFSRIFASRTGISPLQYRKKVRAV